MCFELVRVKGMMLGWWYGPPLNLVFIEDLSVAAGVIYVVLTLATASFFFWNGFGILQYFKRSAKASDTKRNRRLLRVSSDKNLN
jgi:hypothetical protein